MDDLDKQLAELQLITNSDLLPNPNNYGKKIGPAVPPKPNKKQPQVPQSYPLNQQKQPLYSSTLDNATHFYSNVNQKKDDKEHDSKGVNYGTQYANIQQPPELQYSNISNIGQINQKNVALMGPTAYKRPNNEVTYSNIQIRQNRNPQEIIYKNIAPSDNVYSNYPTDDLPPPPPPLEMSSQYAPCMVNTQFTHFPAPPDEFPPPPSPVSSSYSELRQATQPNYNNYMGSQYADYGPSSQSSTYESIYEPINPRPPSQMSSRSNYSLYSPYVSGSQMTGPSESASRVGQIKEREVDTLTNLLVQGMDNEVEADVFGVCVKCKEKIVGANSGCTAMDQLFHTACFTCSHCAINLQGKPFYSLDGNPYCEEDYLNTLEKCCVCMKPILDRILRATGKPYHPKCFTCVICGKSLDGIPFTVDATNQIHCIEDFHKKFAPRCCVCKQPIMPEPGLEETVRVVALDRSFHVQCYKCEDCGLLLSSEAEGRGCYPLDDHVLCKSCNAKRVQALTSHMTTDL